MIDSMKCRAREKSDRATAAEWRWAVGPVESALAEAGEDWHRLAVSTGAPPTALPLWSACMYEAFGQIDGAVSVHRLYAGPQLVAVLSLSLGRGVCRSWRGYQHRQHTPLWAFAVDAQAEGTDREICQHLLQTADMADLKSVPADTVWATQLINGVDPSRVFVEVDPDEADVYLALDRPWEQCLEQVSLKLRRRTEQSHRRLERQGTLAMSVVTDPDDLDAALTECLDLENAGWKGRNGTAILCSPETKRFYRGLASRAAEAGMLGIYMLRLDGRLIAFEFTLRCGPRIDSLKVAYDETMSRESPGNVIAYMIAERECRDGRFATYHWGSPTPSKLRWTDSRDQLVRILLFADTVRGRCGQSAYAHVRPLLRGARQWLAQTLGDRHSE